jgi:cytochrome c biogenesis protein CcmG/thiol:disulfide interchange protein DsbE
MRKARILVPISIGLVGLGLPALERLVRRSQKDGLVMLAVSVDADPTVVAQFLKEQRFTFTVGLDPKMKLADTYGVRALPASFIVDREGQLAALALGPRSWDNSAAQTLVERMSR